MNAMTQAPPIDFAGIADRLMAIMPIILAGIAVLGLAIWLCMKRRDARDFKTYVDVVNDVRASDDTLPREEVQARAFPKYLEKHWTAKTAPAPDTKDKP